MASFLVLILVSLCLVFVQASAGHEVAGTQPIGIEERPGAVIPSDITLADEQGRPVTVGGIVRKPTVLVLVYYSCDRFCPQTLAGLAAALPRLGLSPGKDYQVMTVSFNANDTPAMARDLKRNYLKAIQAPFSAAAWRFLTGDRRNIDRLCTSVGFSFRKEGDGFAHPVALIILSPERRIARYIPVSKFFYGVEYPITFSAVNLTRALADASREKVGAATGTGFLFCFPHEPYRQETFYHILTWVGTGTIIGLAVFFVYLTLSGRRPRKGKRA
jgi:protein SCO1/2